MRKTVIRSVAAAAIFLAVACAPEHHFEKQRNELPPASKAEQIYFAEFKSAFLKPYCLECHNSGLAKGGVDLSSLEKIKAFDDDLLVQGKPLDSLIYLTVLEGSMPPDKPLSEELTSALHQWLERWPTVLR